MTEILNDMPSTRGDDDKKRQAFKDEMIDWLVAQIEPITETVFDSLEAADEQFEHAGKRAIEALWIHTAAIPWINPFMISLGLDRPWAGGTIGYDYRFDSSRDLTRAKEDIFMNHRHWALRRVSASMSGAFLDPEFFKKPQVEKERLFDAEAERLKARFEEMDLEPARTHARRIKRLISKTYHAKGDISPEAPSGAAWGEFAFATSRSDVPMEPNTDQENEDLNALARHVDGDEKLDAVTANRMRAMVTKGEYTDVLELDASKHPEVYRGVAMSLGDLTSLVNGQLRLTSDNVWNSHKLPGIAVIKPKYSATSSWSVERRVAVKFARNNSNVYAPFCVIFTAKISDNADRFILNPDKLYDINQLKSFADEHETIGIGPINASIEILGLSKNVSAYVLDELSPSQLKDESLVRQTGCKTIQERGQAVINVSLGELRQIVREILKERKSRL